VPVELPSHSGQRYTFRKAERLCQRRAFDYLFEHGDFLRIGVLKLFYVWDPPPEWVKAPLSVAFSAPKRYYRQAVTRNLYKRRMREAFRLHKHLLLPQLTATNRHLALVIVYQGRKPTPYVRIAQDLRKAFGRLAQSLEQGSS
jgi:ribonuclease P protein component